MLWWLWGIVLNMASLSTELSIRPSTLVGALEVLKLRKGHLRPPHPKYTLESPATIVQYSQLPLNRGSIPINFFTFFVHPTPN